MKRPIFFIREKRPYCLGEDQRLDEPHDLIYAIGVPLSIRDGPIRILFGVANVKLSCRADAADPSV